MVKYTSQLKALPPQHFLFETEMWLEWQNPYRYTSPFFIYVYTSITETTHIAIFIL